MSHCPGCGKKNPCSTTVCTECQRKRVADLRRREGLPCGGLSLTQAAEDGMRGYCDRGGFRGDCGGGRRVIKKGEEMS